MIFMKRFSLFALVLGTIGFIGVGCGSKSEVAAEQSDQTPVTLTIASFEAHEDVWNQRLGNVLKQKYPYISINYQFLDDKQTTLSGLVSANQVPDIVIGAGSKGMQEWYDLGLTYDLMPLIKKNKYDLNRLQPEFIKGIQNSSPNGQLIALPYYCAVNILYYNKDLFNKFGVPYPKDGITWPEVYDLAKQLTRNEGDVQYRGVEPDTFSRLAREYPLPYVDPKTNQAIVATDPRWMKLMGFIKSLYDIPGNLPTKDSSIGWGGDAFLKDKTLAMWPYGTNHWDWFKDATASGLNWDMVSFPTFPDSPGQGPVTGAQPIGITATSQHKDAAFKILSFITSDEGQTDLARQGVVPVVVNPEVQKQYGADIPELKGKNVTALFVDKFGVTQSSSNPYDSLGPRYMSPAVVSIATGKKDINTALRDAADAINKAVQEQMQQK